MSPDVAERTPTRRQAGLAGALLLYTILVLTIVSHVCQECCVRFMAKLRRATDLFLSPMQSGMSLAIVIINQ